MSTQAQTETTPILKSARDLYEIVKADVIAAAEIMPESSYSMKLDPNVRSFGQQVAHIADTIYLRVLLPGSAESVSRRHAGRSRCSGKNEDDQKRDS